MTLRLTVNLPFVLRIRLAQCVLPAAAMVLASGCSTSRLAVRSMVPILENSRVAAMASEDLRTFCDAAPANLFLLEGLIETAPKNAALRINAAQLYFSYAFAFMEEDAESYASLLYLKGLEHGKAALCRNDKLRKAWDQPFEDFTVSLVHLGEKDMPALVWTVANWSQFISLHLDSTDVLTDIPRVTALIERACDIDGSYFLGLPHMLLGSLHAFRPPMMGGKPEESRQNFERAVEVSGGKFLLAQYLYARFYTYRVQDPDEFEETLREVIAQPVSVLPEYRLLNLIAKQKSVLLLEEKDELF